MDSELLQVLKSLDCVMLKYQGNNKFSLIFGDTPWFSHLFLQQSDHLVIDDQCPFLQDFLIEASTFWYQARSNTLDSGIWTQESDDESLMHFEAQAFNTNKAHYLLVKNLAKTYAEKQRTLQAAREMIIANEDLVAKHHYAKETVESIVSESDNLKFVLETVSKAVDSVSSGIIITDPDFNSIMENQAISTLFDVPGKKSDLPPLKTLFALLDKQFPEFNRMLCTTKPWQGDVCWMQPPFNMKWFMVSVIPIMDEQHMLQHWLFLVSDISRVKYLQQQNEKLTLMDNLTELPNRAYFWNALDSLISQSVPFYLIFVDINNFKLINDEFGHSVGDEVLTLIAEKLNQIVKKEDIVARIGGDEFAIVAHGMTSQSQCEKLVERIDTMLLTPYLQGKVGHHNISLNMGITRYPQDGNQVEKMLKCADIAVTHSKTQANSQSTYYSHELEADTLKRLQLKKELSQAIERQEFELHFQPIYITENKSVAKVEALLRWHHPEHGLVMPDEFISLAEETGLILPLGRWIIDQACNALKSLKNSGHNVRMAINLSPVQLHDKDLPAFIAETLAHNDINASSVELEVTESLLINNFEAVLILFKRLAQCRFKLVCRRFWYRIQFFVLPQAVTDRYVENRSFIRHGLS